MYVTVTTKKRKFVYYSDPGHGWLKVPKKELRKLHVEDRITPYSYQKGENAYLEEDLDMGTFMQEFVAAHPDVTMEFKHRQTDRRSRIRGYESYKPEIT